MPDLPEEGLAAAPIIRSRTGSATVPPWLSGCWTRESIRYAGGRVDSQTRVIWLQLPSAYADIRVPADRTDANGRYCLADFSSLELLSFCAQQAACGTTVVDQQGGTTTARWQRSLGYQPVIDFPEPGRLAWHPPDVLIEQAPSGAYEETWRRLPGCDGLATAMQSAGPSPSTLLYVLGRHAVRVRARVTPVPRAAPLAELAQDCGADRDRLIALLDCEFSYAVHDADAGDHIIRLSTLPFVEGEALGIDWLRNAEPDHGRLQDPAEGGNWLVKEWATRSSAP